MHRSLRLKNQGIVKGDYFLAKFFFVGVLLSSTQNLLKSACVVHASEPCFELCAVKSKPANKESLI